MDALSVKNYVILRFSGSDPLRLERKLGGSGEWLVFTPDGFVPDSDGVTPGEIPATAPLLDRDITDGIYQYRARDFDDPEARYDYSPWVRCGAAGPIGFTFGNYAAPEGGEWGEALTPDDMRYTYLWGVGFKATNGQSYTDDQIRFHIDAAVAEMERRLNITIKKKRIACDPDRRGLVLGTDYDEEEGYYTYSRARIQRNGMISLRKRPVLSISRLDLVNRSQKVRSLLRDSHLDKTKGTVKFFGRPVMIFTDSDRALQNAVYPYGSDTLFGAHLFYAIDYVAGFNSPNDVPKDLRAAIGKMCAIELLNIIGDGLMSGFSSSSLSMDGMSESFSSTQSATSAFYGARIKAYTEELEEYIKANKLKYGHLAMGVL